MLIFLIKNTIYSMVAILEIRHERFCHLAIFLITERLTHQNDVDTAGDSLTAGDKILRTDTVG